MPGRGPRSNGEIDADPVAVVDDAGTRRVMPLADALHEARERGLDLVEVAPAAEPPACRIMDLDAFLEAGRQAARRRRGSP